MGWLGNAMAVVLALALVGLGIWQLGVLIFALLLISPILRALVRKGAPKEEGKPRGKFPTRYAVGGILLVLAFLGYLAHGAISPIAFGSLGAVVLAWGQLPTSFLGSGFRPVEESVLLRSSALPFSWAAVAEVKPLTRDVGRAMAGLTGTVLVSASERPSIYIAFQRMALTERSAEEAMLGAIQGAALSLSALGAYLLPLDSRQAVELLQPSFEALRVGEGGWSLALASGTFDLVSVRQEKGFARSLGLYRRVDQGREGRGSIPSLSREFSHPPLLMEVFKAVGSRVAWPSPDEYTAFLSSLLATSGEPIGTRMLDAGAGSQSQTVLVRSQASPPVELSRAQLRAVARMYTKEEG